MNQKYPESEQSIIITRYSNGESVAIFVKDTEIPPSTIYAWINMAAKKGSNTKAVSLKNYRILNKMLARLQGIIKSMKKAGCSVSVPHEVMLPALESLQLQYSVHMLCGALNMPRGSYPL